MRSTIFNYLFILSVLIFAYTVYSEEYENYEHEKTEDNTYDYIVVGVGQAGSVAVSRLAEFQGGRFKVLGIEWGERTQTSLNGTDFAASHYYYDKNGDIQIGRSYTRFDVPILAGQIPAPPTPYPEIPAIYNGNNVTGVSGVAKLLGGSAAHNGMIWNHHTKQTVDSWGVKGWSYDDFLYWYRKIENATATSVATDTEYHGLNGPIQLSDAPPANSTGYEITPNLLQSCVNNGYPRNYDFSGPFRVGCGRQIFSIGRGVRSSAASAYLAPAARKQGNLHLSLGSRVTKILIKAGSSSRADPEAYGIEYYKDGEMRRVFARREIIITLSAIFTPALLQLSGIGDAKFLQSLGIKVWVNNPNVGQNLHNNAVTQGAYGYPNATYGSALQAAFAANQYAFNGTGPWAGTGTYIYVYACSDGSKLPTTCTDPDISVGVQTSGFFTSATLPYQSISVQVINQRPRLKATVSIVSSDPFAKVNMTLNPFYYASELDHQVFGWQLIRRILNTPPVSANITQEYVPGPNYQSPAALRQWIQANVKGAHHWCGTTKFGNEGDSKRVVDPQLRVVGIKNLRIGDGGVLPNVDSHLQAAVVVTGERVANFILRDVLETEKNSALN